MSSERNADAAEAMGGPPIRAAQYLRKSSDHQKYSTENQSEANHDYAALHGMTIVRTYSDEGKSGLTIARRHALKQLIADVETGGADFKAILVYDVSRWGRFQDADESCYYEHICKRAGFPVHYCAEPFKNDATAYAAIVKSIKRAMAAEYSREVSIKTFAGKAHLVRLGFRAGSSPPYGTRRLLVDASGSPKSVLGAGQQKSLQNDRVVSIPGPPEEVRVVRWIFSAFVEEGRRESAIAKELNDRGTSSGLPRPWTYARIRYLLRNEIYIGALVWNRTSARLGQKKVNNSPDRWERAKSLFEPMIERSQFAAAQAIFSARLRPFPKDDVLEALRRLHREHGFLDLRLIDESGALPSARRLHEHFGGLREIRKLLGAKPRPGPPWRLPDDELLAVLRRLLRTKGRLSRIIINACKDVPSASVYERRFGSLSRTYRIIGYGGNGISALSNEQVLDALRDLLRKHRRLSASLIAKSKDTPGVYTYKRRFGSLKRTYELISYEPRHRQQRPRRSASIAYE